MHHQQCHTNRLRIISIILTVMTTHRSLADFGFLSKVRVLHLKSCPDPPIQMYSAMILPFWGSLRNSASTSSESWVWLEKLEFGMLWLWGLSARRDRRGQQQEEEVTATMVNAPLWGVCYHKSSVIEAKMQKE